MSLQLPEYRDLSAEQIAVMNLELDRNHVVRGAPGTGKSVLALYRAQAADAAGEAVMLVMYNKTLVSYTERAAQQLGLAGVRVKTFHSWFSTFFKKQYGLRAPQDAPYKYDWPTCLEIALADGKGAHGTGPHVIVDEGQDFPPQAYAFLRIAAATLTVFADENQRITNTNSTVQEICSAVGVVTAAELTLNYRNALQVAQVAAHFDPSLRGGVTQLADPSRKGGTPRLAQAPEGPEGIAQVAKYIRNIQRRQPSWSIGVLLPRKIHQRDYYDALVAAGAQDVALYSSDPEVMKGRRPIDFTEPGVRVINQLSAKGLEFDLVFLPELQTMRNPAEVEFVRQMYVLCSRARLGLVLSYRGALPADMRQALPMELLKVQTL
jgi:DNA helicase IV